jgi:hypothetical protein
MQVQVSIDVGQLESCRFKPLELGRQLGPHLRPSRRPQGDPQTQVDRPMRLCPIVPTLTFPFISAQDCGGIDAPGSHRQRHL